MHVLGTEYMQENLHLGVKETAHEGTKEGEKDWRTTTEKIGEW